MSHTGTENRRSACGQARSQISDDAGAATEFQVGQIVVTPVGLGEVVGRGGRADGVDWSDWWRVRVVPQAEPGHAVGSARLWRPMDLRPATAEEQRRQMWSEHGKPPAVPDTIDGARDAADDERKLAEQEAEPARVQTGTGEAAAHDRHEIKSLQRRVLREMARCRPMAETMLAIELAAGHITGAQVRRFLPTIRSYRCVCSKAAKILAAQPAPRPPASPGFGFRDLLLGLIGRESDAWRTWRARREAYEAARAERRRRELECVPRVDAAARPHLTPTPYAGADHPAVEEPAMAPAEGDSPPVLLGPGGDYRRAIHLDGEPA